MSLLYRMEKLVTFEASHQLEGLPPDHQCSRMHGHSYYVWVTLESRILSDEGFVLDFGLVSALIKERYDHQTLNERMKKNPTAENIAADIFEMISMLLFKMVITDDVKIIKVRLREGGTETAGVVEVTK